MSNASQMLSNPNGWPVPGLLTHDTAWAKSRRLRALPVPFQLSKTLIASTSTASIRRCSPDSPLLPIDPKYCDGSMISACDRLSSIVDSESFISSLNILLTLALSARTSIVSV